VWRRRRCLECGAVFSTEESIQLDAALRVRHQGRLEAFSRPKLFVSLYRSCEHRKTALSDAEGLTDTVIARLRPLIRGGTVNSRDVAQVAEVILNRFDKAASSYYLARHQR